MIRQILYYGHPGLRKKCEPVQKVDETIKELIRDMIDTMYSVNGIGLSAPQIGVYLRVFVLTVTSLDRDGYPIYGAPKAYINPTITVLDPKEWIDSEGCLSIPKMYEDVPRPTKIRIEALNEKGEPFVEELEGWMARPRLHENDHLNGVLFVDRILPHRRKLIEPQLKKIKKKYNESL